MYAIRSYYGDEAAFLDERSHRVGNLLMPGLGRMNAEVGGGLHNFERD